VSTRSIPRPPKITPKSPNLILDPSVYPVAGKGYTSNAHVHSHTTTHTHSSTRAIKVLGTDIQEEIQQTPLDRESGSYQSGDHMPYFMLDIVRSDQEERDSAGITPADYGKRWKATFRTITGDAPVCGPRDHDTAMKYWRKLREAVERGGWSPGEWGSLVKAESTWRRRAHGRDPRFEVVGTRPGRVSSEDRKQIQVLEFIMGLTMKKILKGES
jgi:hypothetical protein